MTAQRTPPWFVIALVTLCCVCGCAALLSFAGYEESRRRADQLQTQLQQADEQRQERCEAMRYVASKLGFQSGIDPESLQKAMAQELEGYYATAPAGTYRAVIDALQTDLARQKEHAQTLQDLVDDLQARLVTIEPSYQRRVEIHRRSQARTAKELIDVQQQEQENRRQLEGQISALLDRLETTSRKLRDVYGQREQDREQADRKIRMLMAAVRSFRAEKNLEVTPGADPPDGKVVYVNASAGTLSLDIGRRDGVKPGMTFRVFRPDPSGRANKEVATVEAARVEPNRSTAVIRKNKLFQPILSGDLVFSPVLRNKQTESFALAGKLDVDGDGKDDAALLRKTLERQGGRVDLTIDASGAVNGALSLATKYVVMDEHPERGSETYRDLLTQLHREALDHGIPVISARRFADEIGYQRLGAGR